MLVKTMLIQYFLLLYETKTKGQKRPPQTNKQTNKQNTKNKKECENESGYFRID